jgi:hypothetical protein
MHPAKTLDLLQRISAGLADSLLLLIGFDLQHSSEPKSENAPNNFYQPIPENDRIDGDYKTEVIPSVFDTLDKDPLLQWGALAATGLLALLAAHTLKNRG